MDKHKTPRADAGVGKNRLKFGLQTAKSGSKSHNYAVSIAGEAEIVKLRIATCNE
jgi:hypothetical protein